MLYVYEKIKQRVQELEKYRYRQTKILPELFVKEDMEKQVNPQVPTNFENWEIATIGYNWAGRDKYLWVHADFFVPEEWNAKKIVGIFDFGKTGGGNNSGFESLLYINEKPYQGVDSNHMEVFISNENIGKKVSLTFRLWSGLEGGGKPRNQEYRFKRAEVAWLDESVDRLYYLSKMITEGLKYISDDDCLKNDLSVTLNTAFNMIDWSNPSSEGFYESLYNAEKHLTTSIEKMDKKSNVTINCIGHTHIDVAWLWRIKHTREKIARSFSTVLKLMEMYPEYIFLQTQPVLYEYIKNDFPAIYENIKERVKEGRWEAGGAMWLEADCNLISGESLTRQILYGSQFIKQEFGKDITYLWLPDVFGYSWALPQILKQFGIKTFMTTKISWNQFNRMPHDTFKWRGMDGSEVLAHFITTPEPGREDGSWFYTYNGVLTPETVKGIWNAYSEKNINKELLLSYGYGDGGGGVNREMLEQRRCLDKIPGLPNVKTTTADEYFSRLGKTFEDTSEYVHTWDGELYLEYHRGTYTSQCYNKKMNRLMEFLYRKAEWLTAMSSHFIGNTMDKTEQKALYNGWKLILTNQFHDIIPGSSIREVYEDCHNDYEIIENIGVSVVNNSLNNIIETKENTYTVINASSFYASQCVEIEVDTPCIMLNENGDTLKTQKIGNKLLVWVNNVPPLSLATIHKKVGELQVLSTPFKVNNYEIETPFYFIRLDKNGRIERLYDRENHREVLEIGKCGNVLQFFEDKPLSNDAWDIDIFYLEKMREVEELKELAVTEIGSLRLSVYLRWQYMNTCIEQNMIFYSCDRRIDFETKIDFHETKQLLKVAFPVNVRSTTATYDIQYGNVKRPTHWNTSWDMAKFETVGHRFADISQRDYGVSLLNNCKYGYDIKDNIMRLSLIRGATHPDYLQDQGIHSFTYSLLPHKGDFVEGKTVQQGAILNDPLTVVAGRAKCSNNSFISMDTETVEIDAVKSSEDGKYLVIRLHEYTGGSCKATIEMNADYSKWACADLLEQELNGFKTGKIEIGFNPYEIKTLIVELKVN